MTAELFNQEFEVICRTTESYILRITASIADAEDIVHDTYIKALDKLHTFRGDSSLKTIRSWKKTLSPQAIAGIINLSYNYHLKLISNY